MIRFKKFYDKKIIFFKEEVYVKGVLVLWSEDLKMDFLEIFKNFKIKCIVMVNFKLVFYGKVSMEVLENLKFIFSFKFKIVYGVFIF